MYLKTLELQGFKSFADKTTLELHQGIAAIVGPNGSGKSNIVEAIKWVLGENKAKSLRGHRMEDVIFNGTKKRKPMGMSEVSLILDNSDGGIESDYTEIKVTRRLYRSGDGEYLINGKNCRLKDIQRLFADTGIGNDGYSVIGQGRISQIVEAKPEERRAMVEETAGIVKYRERKKEALRKINAAEENLLRLKDIMTEIESRLEPLERDSENAKKYLLYKEEKDGLSIGILAESALESGEKLKKLILDLEAAQQRYDDTQTDLVQKEALLEEKKASFTELEDSFHQEQQRYHNLSNEIQGLEGDVKSLESRLLGYGDKSGILEEESKQLAEKGEAAEKALKEETLLYAALRESADVLGKKLESMRKERLSVEADLVKAEERMESYRNQAFEIARENGQKKNQKLSLLQTMEGQKRRIAIIDDKQNHYEDEKAVLEERIVEINDFLDTLLSKENEINKNKNQYIEDLSSAKEKINEIREKALSLKMEVSRSEARLKVLEELILKREGFYPGVRGVLEEKGKGRLQGILGVVAEVIKVEKTYTVAMEAALGSGLQNIITETGEDAAAAVGFLKQQRKGIATFLPLDLLKIKPRQNVPKEIASHSSYLGVAADYVNLPLKMKPVAEFLLGNTLLFKNLNDAIALMRKTKVNFRFVSLDGDMVNSGGSVSGGSRDVKKSSFLQRQAETEDLQKRIIALNHEEKVLNEEIENIGNRRIHMKRQLDLLNHQKEELFGEKSAFDGEIQKIDSRRELFDRETAALLLEKEQLLAENLEAEKNLQILEEAIKDTERQEVALTETINKEENAFKSAKHEESKGRNDYTELQVAYAEENSKVEHSRLTVKRLQGEFEECESAIVAKKDALLETEKEKSSTEEKLNQLKMNVAEKHHRLLNFSQEVEAGKTDKANLLAEIEEIEAVLKKLRKEETEGKEEVYKISLKRERLSLESEQSEKELQEEYGMMLSDALPYRREDMTKKEKREKIKVLKQQIDVLGNVNVGAIEEFKTVSERYEFLTKQRDDVDEAKKSLNEVVERMDTIIVQRFTETFDKINHSFQQTFPAFFQGGFGELRLTDAENPLETGVEVVVQPPGKRLQHHSLLSGGELALSGIALLFAILQVKSSPFYVLDEIDAALDDVNVKKFGAYLQEYGNNSQFLVITHRQGTMESAGELYGITMAEEGISRTVSVRLEETIS